jgi:hypothetical protein
MKLGIGSQDMHGFFRILITRGVNKPAVKMQDLAKSKTGAESPLGIKLRQENQSFSPLFSSCCTVFILTFDFGPQLWKKL